MKKNERQIYSNINRIKNSLIKLKNIKSQIDNHSKYNFSLNLFFRHKDKSSSYFKIYKNSISSNNNSKNIHEILDKNGSLFKSEISNSDRKTDLINYVHFDINYLKKISIENLKKKVFLYNMYKMNHNDNNLSCLYMPQNKKRKINFFRNKFLLGQKNYFKKLFQHYDFQFSSYITKRINLSFCKDTKNNNEKDKLKNNYEPDEPNMNSMKDLSDNFSCSSFKNNNHHHNKKNIFNIKNYIRIKIKKHKTPNDLKKSNELLDENIENKQNNIINKEKIIDDNYNEYLKDISSSESNTSKNGAKNINKKSPKIKLKNLKNNILLFNKAELYRKRNKINKNKNSNKKIENNNKLFGLNKINIKRPKIFDDISKSIDLENTILRKKINPEKNVL